MPEYLYPTGAELTEIASDKVAVTSENRVAFDIMPMVEKDDHFVVWEQKDYWGGLQAIRGLNGQPGLVKPTGARRFMAEAGVYGEYMPIDERELTTSRPWKFGLGAGYIDLTDLVMERQDQLIERRMTRIEHLIWTLLTTGTYAVLRDSVMMLTDIFDLRTFTAATPWSTYATATPIANLRTIALSARGTAASFGAGAVGYANQVTVNRMLQNLNANDLFGRRVNGLGTVSNLGEVNTLLTGDGLPNIQIMEEGYYDEALTWTPYIPDGKIIFIGVRPQQQRVGEYRLTRNANNENFAPGAYQVVLDNLGKQIPREIAVHDGHNGGPVIYYPGSVLIANV